MAVSDHEDPKPTALAPPALFDPEAPAPRAADGGPPVAPGAVPPPPPPPSGRAGSATKERSKGRRITFWVGIGLIAAGLSLLAYVAWQLWGTNWVSKRAQKEIVSDLQEDWAAQDYQQPEFGKASALIRIPAFGKKYVVPVLEGTTQEILAKGFGHFTETAQPGPQDGRPGNYALAGHRITHGEPLRKMPELRPGDLVVVETFDHIFTYKLDTNPKDLIVDFSKTWVLNTFPENPDGGVSAVKGKDAPDKVCLAAKESRDGQGTTISCDIKDMYQHVLTLTTCSELFHTDNRMIAFSHLIMVETKQLAK